MFITRKRYEFDLLTLHGAISELRESNAILKNTIRSDMEHLLRRIDGDKPIVAKEFECGELAYWYHIPVRVGSARSELTPGEARVEVFPLPNGSGFSVNPKFLSKVEVITCNG